MSRSPVSHATTGRATGAALALAMLMLAGCANQSYVVLLPDDDGKVGKVTVSGAAGTTLLAKPREGTAIGGPVGQTTIVSEQQIAEDFGKALAASPDKPMSFLLYFELGGAELTAESAALVPKILAEITRRQAPDISVIGHTDTAGDDQVNAKLGLDRAQAIAAMLGNANIPPDRIAVESHGEKNLLVPTPDNTAEPRNRRVEVTVR